MSSTGSRRRQWHPTPVLLPGKSHRRRILEGYSPCSCKESDTTEHLALALCSFLSLESHIQFMSKSSWAFLYNPESYSSSPSKTKGPSLLTLSIPVRHTLLYSTCRPFFRLFYSQITSTNLLETITV